MRFNFIHAFLVRNYLMGQHSRPQVVNTHTHTHRHSHTHFLTCCEGRQRNLFQLTSLIADLLRACKRMGACVRAQDENKCRRRLQVLRAAGRGCLYQNPSGGRECGERDAEGKRLWEIVETTGKSMRKQSRQRRRRERESSELREKR